MKRKPTVDFDTFLALDIRGGVVVEAEDFPEARNPAVKIRVDFGEEIGILQSSARLTQRYTPAGLKGTRVIGVVNFEVKRIAGFKSEFLVLGVTPPDDPGNVVLVRPDGEDVTGWLLG